MYILKKTNHFDLWIHKNRDVRAKARIVSRLKRIEIGNLGDYKTLGKSLCELRVDYGPGDRIYFYRGKDIIIVLLIGGDKSTQSRDIKKAQKIMDEIGDDYENRD